MKWCNLYRMNFGLWLPMNSANPNYYVDDGFGNLIGNPWFHLPYPTLKD